MHIDDEQVLNITRDIWNETLALPVIGDAEITMPDVDRRLTGVIHIAGRWTGSVILEISNCFARRIASIVFNCPEASLTAADTQDAVAEITNMLGGQIKSILPGPSFLSLPSVTHGQDYDIAMPHTRVLSRTKMLCEQEPVRIVVLEEEPVQERARPSRAAQDNLAASCEQAVG